VARFPIYRQIGRRPSQVYVDDAIQPAASGPPERRLFDNVFRPSYAEIGDQIEERPGSLLLLTMSNDCHPIQLSVPRLLEVGTAFGHAEAVLHRDRKILDGLLAEGSVAEAPPGRSRAALSRLPDAMFEQDHPLVLAVLPGAPEQHQSPSRVPGETNVAPDEPLPEPH
jgi:hypothetical protein